MLWCLKIGSQELCLTNERPKTERKSEDNQNGIS
jgi:hypothetical protein